MGEVGSGAAIPVINEACSVIKLLDLRTTPDAGVECVSACLREVLR